MRLIKKHSETRHKEAHSAKKKPVKKADKLDKPIKSNPNKAPWQTEEEYLKKRHRDQIH